MDSYRTGWARKSSDAALPSCPLGPTRQKNTHTPSVGTTDDRAPMTDGKGAARPTSPGAGGCADEQGESELIRDGTSQSLVEESPHPSPRPATVAPKEGHEGYNGELLANQQLLLHAHRQQSRCKR